MQRARQRLIEKGLAFTLELVKSEKRPNSKKIDPEQEANLISLTCIGPPKFTHAGHYVCYQNVWLL